MCCGWQALNSFTFWACVLIWCSCTAGGHRELFSGTCSRPLFWWSRRQWLALGFWTANKSGDGLFSAGAGPENPPAAPAGSAGEGDAAQSCLPPRGAAESGALRLQFSEFRERTESENKTLVANTRSRRALKPDGAEESTRPEMWATACGILYGNAGLLRARCKRCFPGESSDVQGGVGGESASSSDDDASSVLSSSSSSSS